MIEPTIKLSAFTVLTATSSLVAMAFTPSEITAITIASGALIATVFTGVVNIITALRSERKIDHAIVKVEEVHAEAKTIGGHVNSAASLSTAKIEEMQKQIDQLQRMLSDSRETAAVIAQSRADVRILEPIAATVEITTPKAPQP